MKNSDESVGSDRRRAIARGLLTAGMVVIGVLHFVSPANFVRIVPRALPYPLALVYVSGFFEIVGGIGLALPATRKWAGVGLIALFIAVFPANINMAINDIQPEGVSVPRFLLWARLPFQLALVAWAWRVSREPRLTKSSAAPAKP